LNCCAIWVAIIPPILDLLGLDSITSIFALRVKMLVFNAAFSNFKMAASETMEVIEERSSPN